MGTFDDDFRSMMRFGSSRAGGMEKMGGISRNSPCECGSGKKYKHCCLGKVESTKMRLSKPFLAALGLVVVAGIVCGALYGWSAGTKVGVIGVVVVSIGGVLIKPPEKNRDRASGSNIDFGN